MHILFSEATSLHSRTPAHIGLVVAFESKSFTEVLEILAQQWEFCYLKNKKEKKKGKILFIIYNGY